MLTNKQIDALVEEYNNNNNNDTKYIFISSTQFHIQNFRDIINDAKSKGFKVIGYSSKACADASDEAFVSTCDQVYWSRICVSSLGMSGLMNDGLLRAVRSKIKSDGIDNLSYFHMKEWLNGQASQGAYTVYTFE